jgi:large subunit ribosomal protein L18|tara:strand:+ start:763 stop:1260 length:498 start_codon:yes stop_codon:yes gene_type:complete
MKTIKRRRKENKTDYAKRLKMLKSRKARVVVRKTNKYIIAQYVLSPKTQDKIEIGLSSKNLLNYGWPKEFEGSLKSIPASYLTGFLIGKKIIDGKKEAPIIDFGMTRTLHKTKIFAFLKGLVDSGVNIKHDEKTFPEEDRISGKSLKKDFSNEFNKIKSNIENGK